MKYELKEYVKVVKLSKTQALNVLEQLSPTITNPQKDFAIKLLSYKGLVQVDRRNKDKIVITWEKGILSFAKEFDQSCRLILIACITATTYRHFYSNIKKKFGCVPKKSE